MKNSVKIDYGKWIMSALFAGIGWILIVQIHQGKQLAELSTVVQMGTRYTGEDATRDNALHQRQYMENKAIIRDHELRIRELAEIIHGLNSRMLSKQQI